MNRGLDTDIGQFLNAIGVDEIESLTAFRILVYALSMQHADISVRWINAERWLQKVSLCMDTELSWLRQSSRLLCHTQNCSMLDLTLHNTWIWFAPAPGNAGSGLSKTWQGAHFQSHSAPSPCVIGKGSWLALTVSCVSFSFVKKCEVCAIRIKTILRLWIAEPKGMCAVENRIATFWKGGSVISSR